MPTLDPQVFVAIEGAMLSALTREWATALSPVIADLYDLVPAKDPDFFGARRKSGGARAGAQHGGFRFGGFNLGQRH